MSGNKEKKIIMKRTHLQELDRLQKVIQDLAQSRESNFFREDLIESAIKGDEIREKAINELISYEAQILDRIHIYGQENDIYG